MQLTRIPQSEYAQVYQWAKSEQLLSPEDSSVYFYSLDQLDSRLQHLRQVFPTGVNHAIAIKTNPLKGVLEVLIDRKFGLEAASIEEVFLAEAAGSSNDKIVFDSPVKTQLELAQCMERFPGLILNANSIQELERLPGESPLRLALRINPLLKTGAPEVFDVSTKASKFGVPISERKAIIQAYLDYPQLEGIHMHIGSQIEQLDATARAVALLYDLGTEIKAARTQLGMAENLSYMDIGGGFPAIYASGQQQGMEDFVAYIHQHCPKLFTDYEVITEFGRFVHAHNAWVLSEVESVQTTQEVPIAMVHSGADMFVREIYQPGAPAHQMLVLDQEGHLKNTDLTNQHIGGPLCFAGDFIEKNKLLPKINPGDKLIIADAGANTIALWSRHCSRLSPKVIAYSLQNKKIKVIKARESIEDLIAFWS